MSKVSQIWLISMPVAACQLVLLTAAEDRQLLEVLPSGSDLFASALPLAASGEAPMLISHILMPVI